MDVRICLSISIYPGCSFLWYRTAINFLTQTGQICSDIRQGVFWACFLSQTGVSFVPCQNSYCYLTRLVSLPLLTRSTISHPLAQPSPLSLDLSILTMPMMVGENMILFFLTFLTRYHSSAKWGLDRIRRERRLHVYRRKCNRHPRKPHSQCNYWHLGDRWKWVLWYSGT